MPTALITDKSIVNTGAPGKVAVIKIINLATPTMHLITPIQNLFYDLPGLPDLGGRL